MDTIELLHVKFVLLHFKRELSHREELLCMNLDDLIVRVHNL